MNFLTFLIAILYTTQPLKIIYHNKSYHPIRSYSIEHSTWIRLSDLATVLKFDVTYDAPIHKMILHDSSHTISLYAENPFVSVDGQLINLPREVKLCDGELFVSVFQLQYIFGGILGIDFVLDEDRKELRFFDKEVEPERIKLEEKKDIPVAPKHPPKKEEKEYVKIERIVIDPGHGGKDPGAVGPSGLLEKDVNLDVSKVLKMLLEKELEVIMTREDDSFVPLSERARIANEASADLFISIHCNAAPRRKRNSGGVETYFLSVAKTDEARAVEARENASLRFEFDEENGYNFDDVSLILWDLAQNEFLEESENLAESVQKGLAKSLPIEDRGINQAGFYVLNGVYMPSILIECAFISNKKEERLLKSKSFQKKLAEGIFKGITTFVREHEAKSSI